MTGVRTCTGWLIG